MGSIQKLGKAFDKACDIEQRPLKIGDKKGVLFFIECLVDKNLVLNGVIKPILDNADKLKKCDNLFDTLINEIISVPQLEKINLKDAVDKVLQGAVVLAVSGEEEFISLSIQGWETRGITEPPTNSVLKGPREGFVEDIHINLSLIRRRLKTPDLRVVNSTLGRKSKTKVCLVYLNSCVNKKVLKEVRERLKCIDIDGITASYYVESLLRNNNSKLFRQVGSTEKPDIAMAKILEGRIIILVDGTPITLSVPYLFLEDLQNSDDYYNHPARATMIRFIRFFGILIGILLPGTYVALESFHYRILPVGFLISILSSIEGISFPPLVELLIVLFLFEILNEASLRMPKYLGMALSIIGALILGDTAVQAGLITPPSIMIIAISGITLYIIPDLAPITSLLRVLFTLAGGFAGFFGLILGFMFMTQYLVSISNFGAPLMAPFAPSIKADKKDALIKASVKQMVTRPKSFPNNNRIRQIPRSVDQARRLESANPDLRGKLVRRVKKNNINKDLNFTSVSPSGLQTIEQEGESKPKEIARSEIRKRTSVKQAESELPKQLHTVREGEKQKKEASKEKNYGDE